MVPLLDIAQPAVTAGAPATSSNAAAKTATATATTSTDGSPANGAASSKGAPQSLLLLAHGTITVGVYPPQS